MGAFDEKIFGNKKFSKLLEEIYNNQQKKESQIDILIQELKPLIKDIGDATLIVPLLKGYVDAGIKNDEQLLKMATIIQRTLNNTSDDNGTGQASFDLSEEEKEQLLSDINKLKDNGDSDEINTK